MRTWLGLGLAPEISSGDSTCNETDGLPAVELILFGPISGSRYFYRLAFPTINPPTQKNRSNLSDLNPHLIRGLYPHFQRSDLYLPRLRSRNILLSPTGKPWGGRALTFYRQAEILEWLRE